MLHDLLCILFAVTPLGLARHLEEDDEYGGYRIPKGTTIVPNVWSVSEYWHAAVMLTTSGRAILHDENMYPEPLRFNPDRFANEEQNAALGINESPSAAFGFGRR